MIFRKKPPIPRKPPEGPRGYRVYVIGDVHGHADLLDDLLGQIDRDLERRPADQTLLVFVGDLIDRGPGSAQVLEKLRTYRRPGIRTIFLLGNHEEVLLRIIGGDSSLITKWRWFGGIECMASYGVEPETFANLDEKAAMRAVIDAVPADHVKFLESFSDSLKIGDYLIVHAGIRPGIPIDQQAQSDLRWIRAPFLQDESDHGVMVVHGHTITDEVDERANRIGIDTGAYATGRLTALAIDGTERWFLDTASSKRG